MKFPYNFHQAAENLLPFRISDEFIIIKRTMERSCE